jgi:hypothetical protein
MRARAVCQYLSTGVSQLASYAASISTQIVPRIGHIRWDETRRAEELLKGGYDAALKSIDDIKELMAQHAFGALAAISGDNQKSLSASAT